MMTRFTQLTKSLLLSAMTVTGALCLTSTPTLASTLYNEWSYSIDSFNDSMAGNHVGGTKYEIFGMAMKQTSDKIFMAINSNFGLDGLSSQYANDGHVSWGDMLFNFTGQNLDTANSMAQLFGIRFAANNESGVSELGVYNNVMAKEIAVENGQLLSDDSLRGHRNWISSHGGNHSIGDLASNDPYFNQDHHIQNIMTSGNKIGDIDFVSDLGSLGLDFGHFGANGTHTFGFSFDRNLLPDGNFIAHVNPECDNDEIAMTGELEPVPEPSTLLSLGGLSLLLAAAKKRRQTLN